MSGTRTEVNISVVRGDTIPIRITLTDNATSNPLDLTGASAKFAVNTEASPTGIATQLFEITGVISSPTTGVIVFTPSAANALQEPGIYYHDVQVTLASGTVLTPVGGTYTVTADISDAGV